MLRNSAIILSIVAFIAGTALAETRIQDLPGRGDATISGLVTGAWGNTFVLEDDSGNIIVEGGPAWYRELDIEAGERLRVTGRREGERFAAITIEREDGDILRVRPEDGPAPWAAREPRHRADTRSPGPASDTGLTDPPAAQQRGMGPDDINRVLDIAVEYGFVEFDEIEYEGDNVIEVEGWLDNGWEAEIEVDMATGRLLKEKRERSRGGRAGITADVVRQVVTIALEQGMVRFDEIELDSRKIEVDGWDRYGREMEIELDDRDLTVLKVKFDD